MKHMGYFSPTMNSYMVSLKYDFNELRLIHWLYTKKIENFSEDIPIINNVDSKLHQLMIKLLEVVKWIQRENRNSKTKYPPTKTMIKELITSNAACTFLNTMYYNDTLNIVNFVINFK